MPSTINGIGTWYYGKRRIHRTKSACAFCHSFGELESYDTTLYFVVFYVPIFSLGGKRILEQCPACLRHRVIKMSDWEREKTKAFATLTEAMQSGTNRKGAIVEALGGMHVSGRRVVSPSRGVSRPRTGC